MRPSTTFRTRAVIALVVVVAIFLLVNRVGSKSPSQLSASSGGHICLTMNSSYSCPVITAQVRNGITETQVSKFLAKLWISNQPSSSAFKFKYELQRCSNPNNVPSVVKCVFFSSASRKEVSGVGDLFRSSGFFTAITNTHA